jgi:hypothetical protein
LNLGALVRKEGQRGGLWEMTTMGAEEFIDFLADEGDFLEIDIHGIDDQEDLDMRVAAAERPKGGDGLRGFVVYESKVLLLKTGNRRSGFPSDDDIQVDRAGARLRRRGVLWG